MTIEQVNTVHPPQKLYYKNYKLLPDEVEVVEVKRNPAGKVELYLADGSFIPERDLNLIFLTKEECIESCNKDLQERIKLLRDMITLNK